MQQIISSAEPKSTRRCAVVVGAGIAGLFSALALSRNGFEVTILEQDARFDAHDNEDAFERWQRTNAPQIRHSHIFHPTLRSCIRKHYPDLYWKLHAAGSREYSFKDSLPDHLREAYQERPCDDALTALFCRRTTFERELLGFALSRPGVSILFGVKVIGLALNERSVAAIHYRDKKELDQSISGEVFIDASGSRSRFLKWLEAQGYSFRESQAAPVPIIYLTRWYRLKKKRTLYSFIFAGYVNQVRFHCRLYPADNLAFSVTLTCPKSAQQIVKLMAVAEHFQRICQFDGRLLELLDAQTSEATGEVLVMAGLKNVWRDFESGVMPTNLFCMGDALACANPAYGSGCDMAARHAEILARVIRMPLSKRSSAYYRLAERTLKPLYQRMADMDLGVETIPAPKNLHVRRILDMARRFIARFAGRRLELARWRTQAEATMMVSNGGVLTKLRRMVVNVC